MYTREIIGWHISTNHQKDLVIEAFLDTPDKRKTVPIYFHSDQGSEYESEEYLNLIERNGVIVSMSRKSHPWGEWLSGIILFRIQTGSWINQSLQRIRRAKGASTKIDCKAGKC